MRPGRTVETPAFMPVGTQATVKTLTPDEVRDLIAYLGSPTQVALRGPKPPIDAKTHKVPNALEGESLKILKVTAGGAAGQGMSGFAADKWSGDNHLWWTGARPGARLELELPVTTDGTFAIECVLTKARDYGIVQVWIDGERLGGQIDCFNVPDVVTTGVITFEPRALGKGNHVIAFEIIGKHPDAVPGFMVGVDFIRLVPPMKPDAK